MSESKTPRTDAVTYPHHEGSGMEEVSADFARILERELNEERKLGQEVHDYLVSVNPDNYHLSVLESCIQQRNIENTFRNKLQQLHSIAERLAKAIQQGLNHGYGLKIGEEALADYNKLIEEMKK